MKPPLASHAPSMRPGPPASSSSLPLLRRSSPELALLPSLLAAGALPAAGAEGAGAPSVAAHTGVMGAA